MTVMRVSGYAISHRGYTPFMTQVIRPRR